MMIGTTTLRSSRILWSGVRCPPVRPTPPPRRRITSLTLELMEPSRAQVSNKHRLQHTDVMMWFISVHSIRRSKPACEIYTGNWRHCTEHTLNTNLNNINDKPFKHELTCEVITGGGAKQLTVHDRLFHSSDFWSMARGAEGSGDQSQSHSCCCQ